MTQHLPTLRPSRSITHTSGAAATEGDRTAARIRHQRRDHLGRAVASG